MDEFVEKNTYKNFLEDFSIEPYSVPIEVKINLNLISNVIKKQLSNLRSGNTKIKLRGDVNISKKKIRKQKAQSVARVSNRSSPIFRGGGNVNQVRTSFYCKINKKEMKSTKIMCLSIKQQQSNLYTVNGNWPSKTKDALNILKKFNIDNRKILLIDNIKDHKGLRNIYNITCVTKFGYNPLVVQKNEIVLINNRCILDIFKS